MTGIQRKFNLSRAMMIAWMAHYVSTVQFSTIIWLRKLSRHYQRYRLQRNGKNEKRPPMLERISHPWNLCCGNRIGNEENGSDATHWTNTRLIMLLLGRLRKPQKRETNWHKNLTIMMATRCQWIGSGSWREVCPDFMLLCRPIWCCYAWWSEIDLRAECRTHKW